MIRANWILAGTAAFLIASATTSFAGEADVVDVKIRAQGATTFRIDVTAAHADTGWDHYADKWDVLGPDGALLGTRVLHHPHVNEQPFTRSLTVSIPVDVDTITLRAHDSVHKYGGSEMTVMVPR